MRLFIVVAGLVASTAFVAGTDGGQRPVEIVGHVFKPPVLPPQADALKVPPGFQVSVFASGLGHPRILVPGARGQVYVTRREPGDILLLTDRDGDGVADAQRVAVRRPMLHGLTIHEDKAYFVGVNDVFVADIAADGMFTNTTRIVDDLPEAGQHADRTIVWGPDGALYLSVGSTCNACAETSPENATMLRMMPDGTSRAVFASGLRNTIGFAFHPDTRALFGFDHGIDWLGDDEQGEELNLIEEGKQYGWPYIYGRSQQNPKDEPPGGITMEEWAQLSTEPLLLHTAHAAPMQWAFYTGTQFPEEYRTDAFVAMHGSWNRRSPSGYEVVRVRFAGGRPVRIEPFLSGFLAANRAGISGRPFGVMVDADGSLLVGDDENGVIYRVSYRGRAMSQESRQ